MSPAPSASQASQPASPYPLALQTRPLPTRPPTHPYPHSAAPAPCWCSRSGCGGPPCRRRWPAGRAGAATTLWPSPPPAQRCGAAQCTMRAAAAQPVPDKKAQESKKSAAPGCCWKPLRGSKPPVLCAGRLLSLPAPLLAQHQLPLPPRLLYCWYMLPMLPVLPVLYDYCTTIVHPRPPPPGAPGSAAAAGWCVATRCRAGCRCRRWPARGRRATT